MAKKQTRRSISVSRTTYERLKAFCETNNISMSQLVETRVNDFLGAGEVAPATPMPSAAIRPPASMAPRAAPHAAATQHKPLESRPAPVPASAAMASSATSQAQAVPMTSAAARFMVEPPPPIIKPRQDTAAPKPAEKRPEQIFTF
jgi:hypothetical protein